VNLSLVLEQLGLSLGEEVFTTDGN